MKVYEWLTARVKKPEIRVFLLILIWVIGGALVLQPIHDSLGIVPVIITILLWYIILFISLGIYSQRADLEKWVCTLLQSEWEYVEKPISISLFHLIFVLLFAATRFMAPIITISLTFCLALVFVYVLWIGVDCDISKFGESLNNYMSIILGLILMAQVGIVYQQYRHMKQPFFKAPLLWTLSKSKSDTDCCILLKNGGTAPIFDILYYVSEVSVKAIWGCKIPKSEGYPKIFYRDWIVDPKKRYLENLQKSSKRCDWP